MLFASEELTNEEIEAVFLENAQPMPEGYTHIAMVIRNGIPFILITSEHLPAMIYDEGGWTRAAPELADG
jgi:hypothetical protein